MSGAATTGRTGADARGVLRQWPPASPGICGPTASRGSFVSLLLWEGMALTEVAEQAGRSVATLARYYAGVIKELTDQPRVPAGEAIRQAREQIASGAQLRLVAEEN